MFTGCTIMLPQASKAFLGRMRVLLGPLLKGKYLLLTNTLSVGGIMALGDFLQQSREIHQRRIPARDWKRTEHDGSQCPNCLICNAELNKSSLATSKLREHLHKLHGDSKYKNTTLSEFKMKRALFDGKGSMFAVGCSMGPALHYWYNWLDRLYVGTTLNIVTKKVVIDQLIASPVCGAWFFIGMSVTEGHTLRQGWKEFVDKFWEFYKADLCVWPAAQMINFIFLAPKYRVVYISIVTLGWDTYLSYIKHRDDSTPASQLADSSAADQLQGTQHRSKPQADKT